MIQLKSNGFVLYFSCTYLAFVAQQNIQFAYKPNFKICYSKWAHIIRTQILSLQTFAKQVSSDKIFPELDHIKFFNTGGASSFY